MLLYVVLMSEVGECSLSRLLELGERSCGDWGSRLFLDV